MEKFSAWLKRQSEIIVGLGIVGGFLAGIITAFGGHIPPWMTPAQAETLSQQQATITNILQQQSQVLSQLSRKLDHQDCESAKQDLVTAQEGLKKKQNDPIAFGLLKAAKKEMDAIANCVPDPLPR